MTKHHTFTALPAALDAELWEKLQESNPAVARALQAEIGRGATADDVRGFIGRYVLEAPLNTLLEHAAAHLEREQEASRS